MEKFTRGLLTKFVIDKLSAKMVADNLKVIEFIERQATQFGIEKHTAFLEKVFHGKQVSAEHFFKVLSRVEAAIARKAGTKVAKATKSAKVVAKATKADNVWKPVAKATKKAVTVVAKATKPAVAKATKQASKSNAQKESVSSLATLQAEIAKLVKVYNEQVMGDKLKIAVTMSYIVATMQ